MAPRKPSSTSETTATTTRKRSRRNAKKPVEQVSSPLSQRTQANLTIPLDVNGAQLINFDSEAGLGHLQSDFKDQLGSKRDALMGDLLTLDLPDTTGWSITDFATVNESIPEMDSEQADQAVKRIKRQQAHVKVVRENTKLQREVYGTVDDASKTMNAGIKAATSVEQLGEAWNNLELAQENTRLSRVKLQNRRIERIGAENEQTLLQRKLVAQENNYRSKIAELEQRTSTLRESQYYPGIGNGTTIDV